MQANEQRLLISSRAAVRYSVEYNPRCPTRAATEATVLLANQARNHSRAGWGETCLLRGPIIQWKYYPNVQKGYSA
jgi:hypothetical protein